MLVGALGACVQAQAIVTQPLFTKSSAHSVVVLKMTRPSFGPEIRVRCAVVKRGNNSPLSEKSISKPASELGEPGEDPMRTP